MTPSPPAPTGRFTDVRHVTSTGSTNADVLELGRAGEPEGIVVVADLQTAGRGRHDRTWVAEPGSALLASILLRPTATVAPLITAALGVAACDALRTVGADQVALKWPNDLIVADADGGADRKLAGILAEADWPADSTIAAGYRAPRPTSRLLVVAGIGVNVRTPRDAPAEVRDRAIALDALVDDPPAVPELLAAVLAELELRYVQLSEDRDGFLDDWRARCATLGAAVRIDLGADDVEGRAVDLDDQGRLVVQTLEGPRRTFAAGDVVHLRGGHT